MRTTVITCDRCERRLDPHLISPNTFTMHDEQYDLCRFCAYLLREVIRHSTYDIEFVPRHNPKELA